MAHSQSNSGVTSARARRLIKETLVWDDHSGFEPEPDADLEIVEKWRAAGVSFLSVGSGYDGLSWQRTVQNLGAFITWFEKNDDRFVLARTTEDIIRAKRDRKMAVAFDIEGMNALDGQPYMVSLYYRLGVRQMLFAYNKNNLAGGGCHDNDGGLTPFGRRVIDEMNRVGMVVDCTHAGYRTTMEAMEMSSQPVVFSHSNPKALFAHGRNIVDEQIRACARTGGVVGINGIGLFMSDRQASTDALVSCISYVADLVGSKHVGIGLDHTPTPLDSFNAQNSQLWPASEGYGQGGAARCAEPGQILEITEALVRRRWHDSDIRGVLGENFLRVARAVWK